MRKTNQKAEIDLALDDAAAASGFGAVPDLFNLSKRTVLGFDFVAITVIHGAE